MKTKLAYEKSGQGTPRLLLLHGFTGSRAAWNHLRPLLGPGIASIAVDLPGHGRSEPCGFTGREGFTQTLAALVGILDKLGAGPVDVLGYSQGARLALGLAIEWPGRVRRLILESGTAGLKRTRDRTVRRRRDEALAAEIELNGIEAFVGRWEALPLFAGIRRLAPEVVRSVRAERLACSERGLASSLRSVGLGVQPNYWPLLPGLRTPILLLTGRRDLKFTGISKAMARELPMAWFRSFEGVWHAPHLEAPARFADEVMAFLGAPLLEAPLFDAEAVA
ncbi:MAG TPA: 2-succinyl-6-hydroxy-2,4-cyclohexadiene-1-carboxylate synthase [Myxococcaceae bacterium]|nr:2-succinyl-6-hydroxy-2,4-cyclohexadiene-1-carboxylate synthase [Myxococcaceae bacterium]